MTNFVTNWFGPSNLGSGLPGVGNWDNIANIFSKNLAYSNITGLAAGADSSTVTAKFTDYIPPENIPDAAVITGIEVRVWLKGPGFGDAPASTKVSFRTPTTVQKAGSGNWGSSDGSSRTWGGPGDLWGGTWTKASLSTAEFAIQLTNGSSTSYTYGIDYIEMRVYYDAPATLNDLLLSKNTVHANAPVGYVIANISGNTTGSTITTDDPARLEVVGTELRVNGPLVSGDVMMPRLTETLAGATNSPHDNDFMLTVTPPRICDFVSSATGTTTPVIPTHQAGDLLVLWMFRDGAALAPALPSGWTQAASGTGTNVGWLLAYRVATASGTSGGGATAATSVITHVYRPTAGYVLSVGAAVGGSGVSTTVTYPALTLQDTSGVSWVATFGGHRSTNTALETAPSGLVARSTVLDATDEAAGFDTNGGVGWWSSRAASVGGTSSGWSAVSVEIKGAAAGSSRRRSTWISLID